VLDASNEELAAWSGPRAKLHHERALRWQGHLARYDGSALVSLVFHGCANTARRHVKSVRNPKMFA
jgi:hypothetical protein